VGQRARLLPRPADALRRAERARAGRAGRAGKLKPGFVADTGRLARLPTVAAILSLFRAEHDVVCDELAARYPARFGDADAHDDATYEQAIAQP